jgi:hypothetical protein
MARSRKVKKTPGPSDNWEIETSIQINNRNVLPGTELKISGERGRFRFIKYVKTEKGIEWIDVWGGPRKAEQWRSFRPERVKTVHYKNQTTKNLAVEYKQKMADKKEEMSNAS